MAKISKIWCSFLLALFCQIMAFDVFANVKNKLDSLQILLNSEVSIETKVDAHYQLALLYAQTASPEMFSHSYEGQQLARKINYAKGLANFDLFIVENNPGIICDDSLFFLLKEATNLFENLGMKREQAKSLNKLGVLFEKQSKFKLASKCYYKALFLYQEINDINGIASEKNNIGLLLHGQNNYAGAYYFFKQAIAIGLSVNDSSILTNAYNNLAICYYEQKNTNAAINFFRKALLIEKAQGNMEGMAISYNNLGLVYLSMESYSLAKEYLFLSIKTGADQNIAATYNNISTVYEDLDKFDSATYFLNLSLIAAKNNGDVKVLLESYAAIANLYETKKDFSQALFYQKIKNNIQDSISKIESLLYLNELNLENKLFELKENSTIAASSFLGYLYSFMNYLIALLLAVIVICFLSYYFIKLHKQNKQLLGKQRKIEVQNKILQVKNIEILQAKEAAEELANINSTFVSSISNEIRSPINDIIGVANLLKMSDPRPNQLDNLNVLHHSIENLLLLVNNVLDFNKLEAGKLQLENIDFNLQSVALDVKELFLIKAIEKNIELVLNFDENIPAVLKGDPLRINQLLINLVNNAIKFTETGFVKIDISVQLSTLNNTLIHFSVTDTGIGIPISKQSQIFQSFTQADSNSTRKYGGSGLGLSICKRILENLNSKLQMESVVGKGSRFHYAINFEVSRSASTGKSARTASYEDAISGKRVLVVEDNMMNIMVMRQFLQKWGVITEIALNGREAISRLMESNFDAILMDIHMPEMNGIEATKIIRELADERKRKIPIIALTAENELQFRQQVYEVGMNDYIFKPFNPEDFKERLGYALFNVGKKN